LTASTSKNKTGEDIQDVSELVIRDFSLEEKRDALISNDMQEFRGKLRNLINHMLDNDFERLLVAMYRLDINEHRFKMALSDLNTLNVAQDIADLVIEREMQKVLTRRKYRNGVR
jgi:hypothetical protein